MFTQIRTTAAILLAMCVLAMQPAAAFNILQTEEAIESSTSDVRLPANDLRSFSIRTCAECTPMTLTLSERTVYEANNQRIAYRLFRDLSQQHAKSLMVFYDPETMRVTRMTLRGVIMDAE